MEEQMSDFTDMLNGMLVPTTDDCEEDFVSGAINYFAELMDAVERKRRGEHVPEDLKKNIAYLLYKKNIYKERFNKRKRGTEGGTKPTEETAKEALTKRAKKKHNTDKAMPEGCEAV